MKFIYLASLLLCAQFVWSQSYTILFKELSPGPFGEHSSNTIDAGVAGWESNAKIEFNSIGAEFKNITLTYKGDPTKKITPETDKEDDRIVFFVSSAIIEKQTSFDVFFNGQKKGTIEFDVKNIDKIIKTEGGNTGPEDTSNAFEGYIGALTNANFIGNNKFLSNLTPVVNLGGIVNLYKGKNEKFSWDLDVNPYVGGEIDTKDSVSFMPALMLYGRGGFVFNNYLSLDFKKVHLTFMPFGFGLKFIPNLKDSGLTIIQHNIRAGLSLRYDNVFTISAHVTHGWHNLTSQSKENFQKIFTQSATDISYITVGLQMALRGKDAAIANYVYFEWRSLLSKDKYPGFNNNAILTLGLRKTLELHGGANGLFRQASTKNEKSRGNSKRTIHENL
jgi:hypothetical protein